MAKDISQRPLLTLMENMHKWVKSSSRKAGFWKHGEEHRRWGDKLMEDAKGIIIWLELKGQDEAAARLDNERREFRQAGWAYYSKCMEEDPSCYDAYLRWLEVGNSFIGAAKDLDDEVLKDVWEGFFDE